MGKSSLCNNYCGAPRGASLLPPHHLPNKLALVLLVFRAWWRRRRTEYGGVSLQNAAENEKTIGRSHPLPAGATCADPSPGHDPGLGSQESIGYLWRPRGCLLATPPPGFSFPARCVERHHKDHVTGGLSPDGKPFTLITRGQANFRC